MAADLELLAAVFYYAEVDNKVVSNIVGSLDSEIVHKGLGTSESLFVAYHVAGRPGRLSNASDVIATVSKSQIGLP